MQPQPRIAIKNLKWYKDDSGWYWAADFITGNKTGSYYDVDENNQRLSKEEQEQEIRQRYQVIE